MIVAVQNTDSCCTKIDFIGTELFSKYTYLSFLQGATLYEFDEWQRTISKRMAVSSVYKGLPDGIEAAINDYHWVPEYQYIYFFKGQK